MIVLSCGVRVVLVNADSTPFIYFDYKQLAESPKQKEIIESIARGLLNTHRWAGQSVHSKRDVLTHSLSVAALSKYLATAQNRDDAFVSRVIVAALLHDAHELILGDVNPLVKEYHPELRRVHDVYERAFLNIAGIGKDEKKIIRVADSLAARIEAQLLPEKTFKEICDLDPAFLLPTGLSEIAHVAGSDQDKAEEFSRLFFEHFKVTP